MKLTLEQAAAQHGASVYRAAFSVCGNRQDAEDVSQETFLAYYKSDCEFAGPEHLKAWLLRTAVNKSKNLVRSFWRRNRVSLDQIAEMAADAPAEDGELLQAVLTLPERCRVIIHLFYYEEYPVREIASLMGISENTVKSQLHRGRTLLKAKLQEGWNDDEP
ncbi:MAG: sigma-70 family RNA polymerase sigma factor [Oscillospiraceae bacterium]|nr:sigma-70 family RNA polymerase sigma factor [Oscillospiraceae bacterium]